MINQVWHQKKREDLVRRIRNDGYEKGLIIISAAFEIFYSKFQQDSLFWYLTGIDEPGIVMTLDIACDETIIWIPQFLKSRDAWIVDGLVDLHKNPTAFGFDKVMFFGAPLDTPEMNISFEPDTYSFLSDFIKASVCVGGSIFWPIEQKGYHIPAQIILQTCLSKAVSSLNTTFVDILPYVCAMRRVKDMYELELIFKAVDIAALAHEAAMDAIKPDISESVVQASAEYIITGSGAVCSFPSIVGSGKFSTVLHYTNNNKIMKKGEVVVVDLGAKKSFYCSDISRTYPVSGVFSKRQLELYQVVLDAQEYVASFIKKGMWLNNKHEQESSLHHIALKYFKKYGYAEYFNHGIGHMLGLDVHDLDNQEPLDVGAVFTIEPGLYLKDENIGIRIEDNYWLAEKGVICISQEIPKTITDLQTSMHQ